MVTVEGQWQPNELAKIKTDYRKIQKLTRLFHVVKGT